MKLAEMSMWFLLQPKSKPILNLYSNVKLLGAVLKSLIVSYTCIYWDYLSCCYSWKWWNLFISVSSFFVFATPYVVKIFSRFQICSRFIDQIHYLFWEIQGFWSDEPHVVLKHWTTVSLLFTGVPCSPPFHGVQTVIWQYFPPISLEVIGGHMCVRCLFGYRELMQFCCTWDLR